MDNVRAVYERSTHRSLGVGSVLVIVPTYCEDGNVGLLVHGILQALPIATILFIDDNSPDQPVQVADRRSKRFPQGPGASAHVDLRQ